MKRVVLVGLVCLVLTGCSLFGNGGGGGTSGIPQALVDLFTVYGGSLELDTEFVSPTAADTPEMAIAHQVAIGAASVATRQSPELVAFAQSPIGGKLLTEVASKAKCPICKGVLQGAGYSLHFYSPPGQDLTKNMRCCWSSLVLNGETIEYCKPQATPAESAPATTTEPEASSSAGTEAVQSEGGTG